MLSAFFVNFCILVTFSSIGSLTYTGTAEGHSRRRLLRYLISAAGGIALVLYGVPLAEGVRVDFRAVPVLLAGLFGGPLPALAVAAPIMAYRWWTGGAGALAGMLSTLLVALVAGCLHSRAARDQLRWRDTWVPFAVFALANLTLLLVPGVGPQLFGRAWLPLTLLQGVATLVALIVIGLRFTAVGRAATLQDIAHLDALTGLSNRRRFDQDLPAACGRGDAFLLLLDLDHFKGVNDRYGHPFGDRVLQVLAQLLQEGVRGTDQVYRLGGEEFGVLLQTPSAQGARGVAERLRRSVQEDLGVRSGVPELVLTVSGGLAACTVLPEETLEHADRLLYAAKREGRNRVVAGPGLLEGGT